tara:strand:+ start:7289 stop:9490 length:2202 start_codon:yes stop_codon:yes gene_type:complete
MGIIKVAIDVPVPHLFEYSDNMLKMGVGSFVLVPFGSTKKVGVVFERIEKGSYPRNTMKSVEKVLTLSPLCSEIISLIDFTSNYYCHPIGQVVSAFLPSYLRKIKNTNKYNSPAYELALNRCKSAEIDIKTASNSTKRLIGILKEKSTISAAEVLAIDSQGLNKLQEWVSDGWVKKTQQFKLETHKIEKPKLEATIHSGNPQSLTEEQMLGVEKISEKLNKFAVWLLHGVTGSGKTEVYLELIKKISEKKSQVLVLVPEINLTPQLEERFKEKLPSLKIATLNSAVSEKKRFGIWDRAREGNVDVLLGTRLAISVGMPHLRLIIVDEEHDASYKQTDSLRYNARDLAIFRSRERGIPIILSSATPSLETYKNWLDGRFEKISLKSRPNAGLPLVKIVDTRKKSMSLSLSQELIKEIKIRLIKREQTLIFINRRGYSNSLICNSCGWLSECLRCSARMTFHRNVAQLICHYCGYKKDIRNQCPECGTVNLYGPGEGTQSIEEELVSLFPEARILRVDSDTAKTRQSFQNMREKIISGEVDIIVGTQMLSKGHDFPKLTLVGIIGVDRVLYSSDYIAPERLFQQLVQVSGRAGRGSKGGKVLVQTNFPDNYIFQALIDQKYDAMAESMLQERQIAGFPPFIFQILVRAESKNRGKLYGFLELAALSAKSMSSRALVYEPSPAIVEKISGRFRGQLLIQSKNRAELSSLSLKLLIAMHEKKASQVKWVIDRDPLGI